MSCCAHRNILTCLVLSCLVHGDSSGAGGSSCCGHGGHSIRLPPCRGGGSGSCGMSCPACLCLAPEGSWYPLTSPGKFFWGGGKRVPAVGARPRGPRPRPQGPPAMASWAPCTAMSSWAPSYAMASWAPCTAMASWAPSSAMASFVCLFCSGGPRPVFLSVSVLRGLQSAHPPPRWNCYGVGHAFREGGVMSGFCCVCHVFLPLVYIFGLFPVLVKCDHQLICVQLCVCDCVNYPVYLVPVFWVWFRLVYSLLPGVSCLSVLPCPALMSSLNIIIIWVYILVCVFLFLPRVCTVTVVHRDSMYVWHKLPLNISRYVCIYLFIDLD